MVQVVCHPLALARMLSHNDSSLLCCRVFNYPGLYVTDATSKTLATSKSLSLTVHS